MLRLDLDVPPATPASGLESFRELRGRSDPSEAEGVRAKFTAADVSLAVAGVALAGGLAVLLWPPPKAAKKPAATLRFAPGALAAAWTF